MLDAGSIRVKEPTDLGSLSIGGDSGKHWGSHAESGRLGGVFKGRALGVPGEKRRQSFHDNQDRRPFNSMLKKKKNEGGV